MHKHFFLNMARFENNVLFFYSCTVVILARLSQPVDAQSCNANSCILPVPSVRASGIAEYEEAVADVKCQLTCLQETNIMLPVSNQASGWPFLNFSALQDNCLLHSKLQECRLGCVTHFKNPTITSNTCRNICHSSCMNGSCISHSTCSLPYATSCPAECRRTFCKNGCKLYESDVRSSTAHPKPATPVLAPSLAAVEGPSPWLYNMSLGSRPGGLPSAALPQAVGYIVRIQALESSHQVTYTRLWDHTAPLDLGAFACGSISVSFAVASQYNVSDFSPSTEICIPGLGGRPSQVEANSISISYSEDFNSGVLGYAVANVSWRPSQNPQFLTSYTIRLLATATQGCSHSTRLYTYRNISKDATHFTLHPITSNSVLKFGCTYSLHIISEPALPSESGTPKSVVPELTNQPSEIILECHKIWEQGGGGGGGGGTFRVELEWSLTEGGTPINTLSEFLITPSLIDNNTYALRRLYSQQTVSVEESRHRYSFTVPNLTPERNNNHVYEIQVRGIRNSLYFWRNIPRRATCIVPSTAQPPSAVANLTISDPIIFHLADPETREARLTLGLSWLQPSSLHELSMYEVRISRVSFDVLQPEQREDPAVIYLQEFQAPASQLDVNTTVDIPANQSRHCHEATIQMRSENEYGVFSEWSEPLVVQLNDCSEPPKGHVALYFESEGGSTKLLELECDGSGLSSNTTSISQRLQTIEERLDGVVAHSRLSTLEEKLTIIEQKLDMLISLVSANDP